MSPNPAFLASCGLLGASLPALSEGVRQSCSSGSAGVVSVAGGCERLGATS